MIVSIKILFINIHSECMMLVTLLLLNGQRFRIHLPIGSIKHCFWSICTKKIKFHYKVEAHINHFILYYKTTTYYVLPIFITMAVLFIFKITLFIQLTTYCVLLIVQLYANAVSSTAEVSSHAEDLAVACLINRSKIWA